MDQTFERTHLLDVHTGVLVSGSDMLKHWRGTYSLDGYSAIFVSSSDLLKTWRGTYNLDSRCSGVLVSKLERDSHAGWMISHSSQ